MFNNKCVIGLAVFTAVVGMDAKADVVHADDVIVQGSHCVGIDCINGENFGFDTVRLKENNLRIHFDDTSSTGSFPLTDWRILINDTGSGESSHFSIEDSTAVTVPFRIEATAPSNSLVVDATGRIGIKTNAPATEIHSVDSDTPTVRLEQDNSGGWTPQTWDIAGNEANFFIRDVTNGSTLPFRIKPGAAANSLYLNGDSVGIGTSTPDSSAALDIRSSANNNRSILADQEFAIIRDSAGGLMRVKNSTSGQTWRITMLGDDSLAIKDQTTGAANKAQIILQPGGKIIIEGDVDIQGALTCNGGNC
ncbi:hypothetical protein [Kangiella koreensis]|uniref:Uncharacterized protein n=1 Tax=Kangiella koreensis (strain DSM 16069 / JCM 12317 / KCTC 12182 / SW-125) TaxID=523791 RepID=C7R8N9_KANKD|nr:hypothetical protein [Kangiella koreensis]ACV25902.1 conserved hypothetical protein [Kangiella koreensis DSM 16069]